MQLTLMPSGPSSSARALVSPSSAVLLTAYLRQREGQGSTGEAAPAWQHCRLAGWGEAAELSWQAGWRTKGPLQLAPPPAAHMAMGGAGLKAV